jgi:hypothetical protein
MSQRLYHALVLQLSGEGAIALALLEAEFKAPIPDADKIIELATEINRMENVLTVLKGYIGPRFAPLPTPAPPAPPAVEAEPAPPPAVEADPAPPKEKTSRVVDETVSPRFKRVKKLRESSKTTKKKKKDKSDD